MPNQTLKFRDNLAKMIQNSEKTTTWRLFDDKDLQIGNHVDFINWDTKETFAQALLTEVYEKRLGELSEHDYDGHEVFTDEDEMYATYRTFYGDRVNPDTVVKIIRFKIIR